ncbi:hypothetical protein BGZ60DRAFT_247992 [Tricladium varicosporioides]|nr:hypothetical protein BGZ60DRAFT_247992 [Hymenoscyphus varicosporioides]
MAITSKRWAVLLVEIALHGTMGKDASTRLEVTLVKIHNDNVFNVNVHDTFLISGAGSKQTRASAAECLKKEGNVIETLLSCRCATCFFRLFESSETFCEKMIGSREVYMLPSCSVSLRELQRDKLLQAPRRSLFPQPFAFF